MIINTKNKLIEFVKIKMGKQIRSLYVTDTQLELIVDQTLTKFLEETNLPHHYSFYQIKDIIFPTGEQKLAITLPNNKIIDVVEVLKPRANFMFQDIFSDALYITKYMHFNQYQINMIDIHMLKGYTKQLEKFFNKLVNYDYNTISKELYIYRDKNISNLMIKCLEYNIDTEASDEENNLYNNWWIKDRCFAEALIQESDNLVGIPQLENGINFQPDQLRSRGEQLIEKSDEDINKFLEPPMFTIY